MSELVKGFSKTFGLGLTLTPSNVRIYRRVLLQTIKYRKFHLPGFTNWGLKFVISEGIKIFSDPWLTFTPPHFRISERNFKKCLDFRGCKCPDIWKDFSSTCTLTTEYPPSGGPQPRRRCTYTDEREMPVRTTGENLLDDGLKNAMLLCILKF